MLLRDIKPGDVVFWDDPGGRVAHRVAVVLEEHDQVVMECGDVYFADELRRATMHDARHPRCRFEVGE